MKTSKAYKKFLRSHRRSIDMIRRHLYHYKNQHNKWSEYDDDLFRAGIIFSVAAMDAYFTDRFCESFDPYIRKFGLNKEMDKLLYNSGFDTKKALSMFDQKRPKSILSNMVRRHLSSFVTQNFNTIDNLYQCLGFNKSFTKSVQGISKRKNLLLSLKILIDRRHKIVHAGDYNCHNNLNPLEYRKILRKIIELEKLVFSSEVLLTNKKI